MTHKNSETEYLAMPKIGMRIFKTAVAVFLCFLIDPLRGAQGGVFYAAIAAVICMQPSVHDSARLAMNRTVATFFGGLGGLLLLLAERGLFENAPLPIKHLIIAACIIPLIYLTVLVKMPGAASITCVVFLSVTLTHGADANVVLYAVNRIIDTLLGIFVSLFVNAVHLPLHKRRDTLYLYDLDGNLAERHKVAINRLFDLKRSVGVYSLRLPPLLPDVLHALRLRLPAVLMGGAVTYDTDSKHWACAQPLPPLAAMRVRAALEEQGLETLAYAVRDGLLCILHKSSQGMQREFLRAALHTPCVTLHPMPKDALPDETVCLCGLGEADAVRQAQTLLAGEETVQVQTHPYGPGMLLEVRGAQATVERAAQRLREASQAQKVEYV